MVLLKRLRALRDKIRVAVIMARTWWWVRTHKDEIQQLAEEMSECEDCVLDEICEQHREQMDELSGGFHD